MGTNLFLFYAVMMNKKQEFNIVQIEKQTDKVVEVAPVPKLGSYRTLTNDEIEFAPLKSNRLVYAPSKGYYQTNSRLDTDRICNCTDENETKLNYPYQEMNETGRQVARADRDKKIKNYKNENWGRLSGKRKLVSTSGLKIIYPTFGIEVGCRKRVPIPSLLLQETGNWTIEIGSEFGRVNLPLCEYKLIQTAGQDKIRIKNKNIEIINLWFQNLIYENTMHDSRPYQGLN